MSDINYKHEDCATCAGADPADCERCEPGPGSPHPSHWWKDQPALRESPIKDQPAPVDSTGDCWKLVFADMEERRRLGIVRYGKPVQPFNGRDALVDAYQEVLDCAVYLRQAIEERDLERAQNEIERARRKNAIPDWALRDAIGTEPIPRSKS